MDLWEFGLRIRRVDDALQAELGNRVTDAMVQHITPFRYHERVALRDPDEELNNSHWPDTPDVLSEDE